MTKDVMRLESKPISDEQAERIAAVKKGGNVLWNMLDRLPPSREVSIAKTKLEEAVMWAVKGITND